jgi:hypothetical protein
MLDADRKNAVRAVYSTGSPRQEQELRDDAELRQPTNVRLTIIGPSTVRNTLAMAYGTATPSTGV